MTHERSDSNQGMIVHGDVQGGAIAVGYRATAVNVAAAADARLQERGLDEVRARLDQLLRAVAEQREELDSPEAVSTAAESIAGELAKEQPSKPLLTVLLDGLAASARSVAGVLTATEALRAAIAGFL
jgi:hypothetical protein